MLCNICGMFFLYFFMSAYPRIGVFGKMVYQSIAVSRTGICIYVSV
jgi:hypothetical protein